MELFTACCRRGQLLLKDDEHKRIVLQSIIFLCRDQRIRLFGYVILEDEFHVLWEKQPDWQAKNIRQMMLKFTAQQIKHWLLRIRSPELEKYKSTLNDRHYHFWDKTTYFRQIPSLQMVEETIQHLHEAPVLSGLSLSPEAYVFSSARFYRESFHTPLSPIANTYVNVLESAKTYDLSAIKESDAQGGAINVPQSGKTYDLPIIKESDAQSGTIDVLKSGRKYDLPVIKESDGQGGAINVLQSGKTNDLPIIKESDAQGGTINVPESGKTYDLTLVGESDRHPNGKTNDPADTPGYAMTGTRKLTAEIYALETGDTQDYHGLCQLPVNKEHILPDQADKTNDHSPAIGRIYRSLQIIMPGKIAGPSIVSRPTREKENSTVITDFRMAFKVLKIDSG